MDIMGEATSFFNQTKKAIVPYPLGRGQGALEGLRIGARWGLDPLFVIGGGAYGFATGARGHKISHGISTGTGFALGGIVGGIAGGLLGGNPISAYLAALAGQFLLSPISDRTIAHAVQPIVDFNRSMRHSNFGGDYKDTNIALTMRQTASREMSGSLLNARRLLGLEGSFMAD